MNANHRFDTACADRTFAVEPVLRHDGLRHGLNRRTFQAFKLHLTGNGHWGTMDGVEPRHFHWTREAAEKVGRAWVETGVSFNKGEMK